MLLGKNDVTCKLCGSAISESAKACPKCGSPNVDRRGLQAAILMASISFVVIIVWLLLF